jgi:L-arabinose isomerase
MGNPGSGKAVEMQRPYTAAKAKNVLGMTYRPVEDTVNDVVQQAVELGWSIDAPDAGRDPAW